MTYEYTMINRDDQIAQLKAQIAEFERTHYNHATNVIRLKENQEALGLSDEDVEQQVAENERNMATIEAAISTNQSMIAGMEKEGKKSS